MTLRRPNHSVPHLVYWDVALRLVLKSLRYAPCIFGEHNYRYAVARACSPLHPNPSLWSGLRISIRSAQSLASPLRGAARSCTEWAPPASAVGSPLPPEAGRRSRSRLRRTAAYPTCRAADSMSRPSDTSDQAAPITRNRSPRQSGARVFRVMCARISRCSLCRAPRLGGIARDIA